MPSSRPSWPSLMQLVPRGASVALVLTVILAGCAAGSTPAPSAAPAAPVVSGAWVRPPTGPNLPAAGYLTISSSAGDALTAVSTTVASSVEMHETTTMSGMTGMQPVSKIEVPAGGSVELKPGGYHLMLMGVNKTLNVGDTVELVLTFEKAGKVTVNAEVKNG